MQQGRHIEIRGTVQGVGFRPWVFRVAHTYGIAGTVRNDAAGVAIDAFAEPAQLEAFIAELKAHPPPAARIRSLTMADIPPDGAQGFRIVHSEATNERRVSIPADLALCADCERELFDPRDRRHRYAFVNCTNCGPRFTIARDVPYDRSATTMAPFVMCERCQLEYDDPYNRRFHAQPNACPECGPHLFIYPPKLGDPIAIAADALRSGKIVAIKGLGGFHLACDATSSEAVKLLRSRKRREERAFAVMVRTAADAHAIAEISPAEEKLLTSVERPIVLLRSRGTLAKEVAPGNPLVGVMLAYTPLHHLLCAEAGRPLVMTSGNVTDEPIAYRNEEALQRLKHIADVFVLHDREIETRCDDSVARVVGGAPMVMRRSRGYVPRSVHLAKPIDRVVLAVGADLKNTFCVAFGDTAYLGPHIGDLGTLETWASLQESIERMLKFLKVKPDLVACDLHPDSIAAGYARMRHEPVVPVQHHHAHVMSAAAEHGLQGPVIGVAWDGTGYGPDGTLWGGELLICEGAGFQRVGTTRPLLLAGGERAIRDIWRIGLAAALDAYGGNPPLERLKLFRQLEPRDVAVATALLQRRINTPAARGIGRYFDAAAALALGRERVTYEGQAALEWNLHAGDSAAQSYPFELADGVLDLRPAMRALIEDILSQGKINQIAAAFHETLAAAAVVAVKQAAQRYGRWPVVLTGGCFANERLALSIKSALEPQFAVYLHRDVPPGDGGIALGQAVIASR